MLFSKAKHLLNRTCRAKDCDIVCKEERVHWDHTSIRRTRGRDHLRGRSSDLTEERWKSVDVHRVQVGTENRTLQDTGDRRERNRRVVGNKNGY